MDSASIVGSSRKSGIEADRRREDIWWNCIKCERSFRASCGPRICNRCRYGLSTKHSLQGDQPMKNEMKQQSYPKGEIGSKSKQLIPELPDGGEKIASPKQDNESNMKEQSVDYKRALLEGPKLKEGRNKGKGKENDSRWESLPKEFPEFLSTEEFVKWLMRVTEGMGHKARWEYLYSLPGTPKEEDFKRFVRADYCVQKRIHSPRFFK